MSSVLTESALATIGEVSALKDLGQSQSEEADSTRLTDKQFAIYLTQLSFEEAIRAILRAEPEMRYQLCLVKLIPDEEFRYHVANGVFGEKIAGDIGARSTRTHPKTDYGEPSGGGGMDFDLL